MVKELGSTSWHLGAEGKPLALEVEIEGMKNQKTFKTRSYLQWNWEERAICFSRAQI